MTTFSLIEQRRIEAARLEAQQAQILRDLAQDTTLDDQPSKATAPGDTAKLRGIPAIGRGVGGVIPGTIPGGSCVECGAECGESHHTRCAA